MLAAQLQTTARRRWTITASTWRRTPPERASSPSRRERRVGHTIEITKGPATTGNERTTGVDHREAWYDRPSGRTNISDRFLPDKAIDLIDEAGSG